MAENLGYLPSVTDAGYSSFTQAMYYVYYNSTSSVSDAKSSGWYKIYGALYNWTAATTACPVGWHLPNSTEWSELMTFVGGEKIAAAKLKSASYWKFFSGITNEDAYGFSALPGGLRGFNVTEFSGVKDIGVWWTSEKVDLYEAKALNMFATSDNAPIYRNFTSDAYSIRCVQD